MENLTQIEKEELISRNFKKFKKIFRFLDKDHRSFAEKLCRKAAFMDVTLDEMQEQITEKGYVVEAINGNGFKVLMDNPALKSYNTMIKNYTAVMKQLADLLPDGSKEADEIMEFMRGKKK